MHQLIVLKELRKYYLETAAKIKSDVLEYVRESQERFDEFCVKQVCFGIVDTISATDFYTDSRAQRTPEAATVGEHTPTSLSSR